MTRLEAEVLAEWLSALTETNKVWSITVSEIRKRGEDDPTRYRVLIERIGDPHPVAIYRARILSHAVPGRLIAAEAGVMGEGRAGEGA